MPGIYIRLSFVGSISLVSALSLSYKLLKLWWLLPSLWFLGFIIRLVYPSWYVRLGRVALDCIAIGVVAFSNPQFLLIGLYLMLIGQLSNLSVVSLNGFSMPILISMPAHLMPKGYIPLSAETRLRLLCDRIQFPTKEVVSLGDMLGTIGSYLAGIQLWIILFSA